MLYTNSFISRKLVLFWLILISTTVLSNELVQRNSDVEREKAAKQVAQQFMQELGGHLKKEMQIHDPVDAIKVCRDIAPEITNRLSLENGWRVTRVTTKPRNALLGTASGWERETLLEFESRVARGEKFETMVKAEVIEESGKSYFRFMKPIAIKPVCLACHGDTEQISDEVKTKLETLYPYDQAINYKLGELRGAISIKQPMDIPLAKNF